MKILITGGLGYVGGRIAQIIAAQGSDHELLIGSRKKTGDLTWLPGVPVVQINWDLPDSLVRVCEGVDTIIHLAGMNAEDSQADPVSAVAFAASGTTALIHAAVSNKVKRIIFFSTAHVYCSPLTGTITEDTIPESLHPYAISHLAAEDIILAAHEKREIEGIVVRLSNSFGAPAHKEANCWKLLFTDLSLQTVTEKQMVLRSSGMQKRDFITLTDVCRAVVYLLSLDLKGYVKTIFNVGGEWAPTVWEVAQMIRDRCTIVLGFTPILTRLEPQPSEDVAELDYRIDVLKKSGFMLNRNIEDEIDHLLLFCNQLNKENSFDDPIS